MYPGKFYFEDGIFKLIDNDTFKTLKQFDEKTFDMIFADPPYFLSNDGITCSGGKMVSVNKGKWDKGLSVKEKHEFKLKRHDACLYIDAILWYDFIGVGCACIDIFI